MQKKLAIIGGGASGFAAAIEACYNSKINVTIYDKLPKACKKILATGNGRCNFSNTDLSPSHFHGNRDFLKYVLK